MQLVRTAGQAEVHVLLEVCAEVSMVPVANSRILVVCATCIRAQSGKEKDFDALSLNDGPQTFAASTRSTRLSLVLGEQSWQI